MTVMILSYSTSSGQPSTLWMTSHLSTLLTTTLTLVSSENLMWVHFLPFSVLLIKVFHSVNPSCIYRDTCSTWTTTFWMQPSKPFLIHQAVYPSISNLERRMLWGTCRSPSATHWCHSIVENHKVAQAGTVLSKANLKSPHCPSYTLSELLAGSVPWYSQSQRWGW